MKKEVFLKDIKNGTEIKISLMVMRVIFRDTSKVVCILADKTGEIKAKGAAVLQGQRRFFINKTQKKKSQK